MSRFEIPGDDSHKVGLDIGTHSVKGVEVSSQGSEVAVRSAGSVVLPNSEIKHALHDASTLTHAIKSLWSSARFGTKRVAIALPPDAVYLKWMHTDAPDDGELDNIAHTTGPRGAPFSGEEIETENEDLGDEEQKQER